MNREFKKNIPQIKKMFSEGRNIEEISKTLKIGSYDFLRRIRKYSSEFSDLTFNKKF